MTEMILKTNGCDFLFDETFSLTAVETPAGTILPQGRTAPFVYAAEQNGTRREPVRALYEENKLRVTLDDGETLCFTVDEGENGLIFTLNGEYGYAAVTVADFTPEPYKSGSEYAVCGLGMSLNCNARSYPTHTRARVWAEACAAAGFDKASFAVVCAPVDKIRDCLKKLSSANTAPFNPKGGAFALDCPDNFSNYYIVTDKPSPSAIVEQGIKYKSYGIDQLDFHQGSVYIQGSMRFDQTDYPGGAADFGRLVSGPLAKAGVLTGFHSYAYFIACNCHEMTADPWVQSQLCVLGEYGLSAGIGADETFVPSEDDLSGISTDTGFFEKTSKYILIDTEIIEFTSLGGGFAGCRRGSCATTPAPHTKGSVIRHLANMFYMFSPVPGSELFYLVARNTAEAYNKGGFNMIYLDALDGLGSFNEQGLAWYHAAGFVKEILEHCDRPPLIEYSTMYPSLWSARSRMGAWDVGAAGHKRYLSLHASSNEISCGAVFLPSQLGWYTFHPAALMGDTFPNAQVKTLYEDDMDHLGRLSIAHNSGYSFMGVGDDLIGRFPVIKKNIDTFLKYDRLKKRNTVPAHIREKLKKAEYRLNVQDGGYSFTEKRYAKAKIGADTEFAAHNPFGAQKPFIRFEALYTAAEGEAITLATFDEKKPLDGQQDTFCYEKHIDLSRHRALKLRIRSDNKKGVLCVQLRGPSYRASGGADHYIPLDFEGTREFILLETENGDYAPEEFGRNGEHPYDLHFNRVCYDEISQLKLFKKGDCSGIYCSDIRAFEYVPSVMIDPGLRIKEAAVYFECELKSSEYIEYTTGEKALLFDSAGQTREIAVKLLGDFTFASGENTVRFVCPDTRARAQVTVGFDGEIISEKYTL